ncbi:MAG: amidohydrolase family protein [Sulfolobales archaeon]|nr:amidohydrolase family protein [Sulfolobales archaeon]
MYSIIVSGGVVVDGSGSPSFKGCVAVEEDKVAFVGREMECRNLEAENIVDASDLYVAPGFIDIHSHFDETLLLYPSAESALLQGITTGVGGNCGYSQAPLLSWWLWSFWDEEVVQKLYPYKYYPESAVFPLSEVKPLLKEVLGYEIRWSSFREYFEVLKNTDIGINIAVHVGHNTVRAQVMGRDYRRRAKPEEVEEMKKLVEDAMEAGAIGLSTGLDYEPGAYADTEELVELAKVVASYGGVYSTHWRRTGVRREAQRGLPRKIEGVFEAVEIGRRTGVRVEVSHLLPGYVVYPDSEELWRASARETIKVVEKARESGLDIGFDVIPAETGGVFKVRFLASLLAPWLREAGSLERLSYLLRARDYREEVKKGVLEGRVFYFNPLYIADIARYVVISKSRTPGVAGLTLEQISAKLGVDIVDAVFKLLIDDPETEIEIRKSVESHEAALEEFVKHRLAAVVTDTFTLDLKWEMKTPPYYLPHSNTYGCFPRYVREYVVNKKLLTIEEAIEKITRIPAERMRLVNRGSIRPGYYADLVVFDLGKLDHPLEGDPRQPPKGIRYVIVNGKIAVENGKLTGVRAGKVLLRSSHTK